MEGSTSRSMTDVDRSRVDQREGLGGQEPGGVPTKLGWRARIRTSLVAFDQALSSASNLLLLLFVAHLASPSDFGRFSLLFVVYMVVQFLNRALVSVPTLVHPEQVQENPRSSLGAAIVLSAIFGAVCALAGAVMWGFHSAMGAPLVVLGALMIPLLLQDAGRYLAIAQARPRLAITLDTQWLVFAVVAFIVIAQLHLHGLVWQVLAWGGTGALAGCWVFVQYGLLRPRDLNLAWVRSCWDFAWRSLVSTAASQSLGLLGASLVAVVSSPLAVAAVRGAMLLVRPSSVIQLGVGASASADIAREKPDDLAFRRHQRRALWVATASGAVNMLVLLAMPASVGHLLLGQVWPLVHPLLFACGLFAVFSGLQTGARAVLIGRREMNVVMWVDIAAALVGGVVLVWGAEAGGVSGSVWGTAIGQGLASVVWLVTYRWYLTASRRRTSARHRAVRRARRRPSRVPVQD